MKTKFPKFGRFAGVTLGAVLGATALTAFTPWSEAARVAADKREDHMVIAAALNNMITGQAALRGVVMPEMTIEPLPQDGLGDRKSEFLAKFFPNHAQLVSMTAKDFLKKKPAIKLERQLLDTRTKIDFLSMDSLAKVGLLPDTPTDSSYRVLKNLFPDASNFVAFSTPGYDSGHDVALVSYFVVCGTGCYQKGYIVLERNLQNRTWRPMHRALVFGGG